MSLIVDEDMPTAAFRYEGVAVTFLSAREFATPENPGTKQLRRKKPLGGWFRTVTKFLKGPFKDLREEVSFVLRATMKTFGCRGTAHG